LKEHGKFQIQAFFIQILFLTADDSSACCFCIVVHDYNCVKIKIVIDGIKVLSFLVLKRY